MDRAHVLDTYVSAWAERSEEGIRQALAECWTESSTYVSPLTDEVRGLTGLAGLILDLPVMFPGASIGPTGPPDVHHDWACLAWRLHSTAPIRTMGRNFGRTLDGVDFVEFDDHDRIRRITAFFGVAAPGAGRPGARATADGASPLVLDLADDGLQDRPPERRPARVH